MGQEPSRNEKIRVLMVCLGNICRSPTAEAVLRARIEERGLSGRIVVDSAGTGDWHVGHCPDPRAQAAAARRHYDLSPLLARQVSLDDFARHDYVLAMDWENLKSLRELSPPEHHHKISLLLDYADNYFGDVPDPYEGGEEGFELVLDLVEEACENLLDAIVQKHALI